MSVSKGFRKLWSDNVGEPAQNVGKVMVGKYLTKIAPSLS